VGDKTGIEWADDTWNPLIGCSKITEGCRWCYAIGSVHRGMSPQHLGLTIKRPGEAVDWTGEVRLVPHLFDKPSRHKTGRRIFVNSLSDLFHPSVIDHPPLTDEGVRCARCVDGTITTRRNDETHTKVCPSCAGTGVFPLKITAPRSPIAHLVTEMVANPQHKFQVLTKRPQLMARILASPEFRLEVNACLMERGLPPMPGGMTDPDFAWPRHIWWGCSIELDKYAFRANYLRAINGLRWISAEPLLGGLPSLDLTGIDWVVAGGETLSDNACHPDWVRDLRDRCSCTGARNCQAHRHTFGCYAGTRREHTDRPTAFLFKQWGDWLPWNQADPTLVTTHRPTHGLYASGTLVEGDVGHPADPGKADVIRVGHHAAGRMLDGRKWDEYPS